MLEYIKSDKTLSFSHWRYKTLHWFFGINPKTVDEAVNRYEMPRYFYTHFCPLFHITNLIVILFPLVILFKVIWFVASKIFAVNQYLVASQRAKKAVKKSSDEFLLSQEYKLLKGIIDNDLSETDFDRIWRRLIIYSDVALQEKVVITREAAEKFWAEYRENVLKTAATQQEAKARRRRNIVFWVNFSRVAIKGILNVVYVLLTALVAYWIWSLRHVFFNAMFAVWSFDVLATFLWLLTCGLKVTLGSLILYVVTSQIKLSDKITRFFGVAHDIIREAFDYVAQKVFDVKDFVAVFYDENCPEIHIVETEQGGEV